MRDDLIGDLAGVTPGPRWVERDCAVKAPGSQRRGRTGRRDRRRCRNRSWRCDRASGPVNRLGRRGLCTDLPARDLRMYQQSGVAITDGGVLPPTQTAITLGSLVVTFCICERILLPRQQCAAVADRAEQHQGLLETRQVEVPPEVVNELGDG